MKRFKHRGPTAKDVADAIGVSPSAVSRALRADASASPAMRVKVQSAADRLGYRPNVMARAIVTGHSDLVGIVLHTSTISTYPEALETLTTEIERQNRRALLFTLVDGSTDTLLRDLLAYGLQGIIALCDLPDALTIRLKRHHLPVVLLNRTDRSASLSSATCDHFRSGQTLARRLLAVGYRRFALICGPENSRLGIERIEGVAWAVSEYCSGQVVTRLASDYSYAGGKAAMAEIAMTTPWPDVVVAANDLAAIGALDHARLTLPIAIPRQLGFAGFDGTSSAQWSSYSLTTMRTPIRNIAAAAVDLFVNPSEGECERRIFAAQFVQGATTRANG